MHEEENPQNTEEGEMVSIESSGQKLSECEIESLWKLFNGVDTTNDKKHEIEARLRHFQLQDNAWQQCLPHLGNIGASMWFFNASTVEVAICRMWEQLPVSSRNAIRAGLWSVYVKVDADLRFQRNKLAQLIALVGKREFPQDHPSYVSDVMNLLKENFFLGIVLLKATSEEVTSTKEDVTSERKRQFQGCVAVCVPEIFRILNKFISVMLHRVSRNGQVFLDAGSEVKLDDFENNFKSGSLELLSCVQHLFSWVPLEHVLDDFLLGGLFELAKWNVNHSAVSTSTLTTTCELFYRQTAIPHVAIATGIMNLLQEDLKDSSEMYEDKLTELLRLFTTQQASRWIADDTFLNLLYSLYNFTFAGYGALAFTERLAIWTPIVKTLLPKGFGVYTELLMSLVAGTINKMQFQNDQNDGFLEVLDNSTLDDDLETEWQHFLSQCIETVALIAEGSPEPVLEIVLNAWKASFEVFLVIEKAIINESSIWTPKCHYIHCVLRDLSSLCQTLSRLVPIIEACSARVSEFVLTVAISLVLTVKFLATKKPYKMPMFNGEIQSDFAEALAQMLAALRGLLPWSTVLKFDASVNSLIDVVVQILLPTETPEPKIVTLAAAQLLLSISSIMRPNGLHEQSGMLQMIQAGRNVPHLDRQTSQLVFQSICNCLILPHPQSLASSNQQEVLSQRALRLSEYINSLARDLLAVTPQTVVGKLTEIVVSTLSILREILDYYESSASMTKQLLLSAFRGSLEKSLQIYNEFYSTCPGITDAVLSFGFSVIRTLQIQLGTEYVRYILGIFLNACTKNSFTESRMKSTETLLQILCLIVKTSGAGVLLPAILELTLDHLVPFLVQESNWSSKSDIVATLYELFDGILINHWNYFYKTNVLRRLKTDAEMGGTEGEKIQHAERFLAILTMYGDALVQNDPHICQIVLKSLQSVNEHWKLYQKEAFQTHLLSSFQYTLINCLLMPEGALFYDQLMQTLFTMGQVNSQTLYRSFLAAGFTPETQIVREICATSDLPTFSFQMGHLIQDTRCGQNSKAISKPLP